MHRMRLATLLVAWILLAAHAIAANVRWTGNAQDVAQVTTITSSGTWATGDTATITCNKKSVTVTLGTAVTNDDVVEALAAAINAGDATTDLVGDETRNVGGQSIPEFVEIEASSSGAVLTLRSATPGVPFTVTRSEATAGDGALGAVTAVTAATGKNWLSNADNYEGGALPVDNDVLYIDSGSVSILYGLDYFRTNSIDLDVVLSEDWLGQLGLPLQNAAGYVEYRSRYFQFRGISKTFHFVKGTLGSVGQGRCWVDFQDQTSVTCRVSSSRGNVTSAPSIFLAGPIATGLLIERGSVSIEPDDAPTDPAKRFATQDLQIGRVGSDEDCFAYVGRNANIADATRLQVHSGTVVLNASTDDGVDDVLLEVFGGSVELRSSANYGPINVYSGGVVTATGQGAIDTVQLLGGSLDFRDGQSVMITPAVKMYAGSSLYDPVGGSVTDIDLVGCGLPQVTLELPANRHIDLGSTATP